MGLTISLLGPVEARLDGTPLPLPTRQAARLLTLLAASPGRPVPATDLVDGIWGASPPATAGNTLQVHVSTLRRAIGRGALATVPGGYRLDVRPEDVDETRFGRLVEDAAAAQREGHLGTARDAYRQALGLWRGEPFADVPGPGLADRRRRLTDLAGTAEEELLACRLDLARDPAELGVVVADAHALAAAAPSRARRWVLLIRALAAAGRLVDAGRAFRDAAAALRDELGLDPGPQLRSVHAAALRQDDTLLPRAWGSVCRIPTEVTQPAGRPDGVAEVRRALLDPSVRLVTLTGPPRSGRTQLAIAAARDHRDDATGGLVVVEPGDHEGGLTGAVAAALGIPGDGAVPRGWGPGPALLVVDDADRSPCPDDIVALLRANPRLTVLATARHALAAAGERVIPVPVQDGAAGPGDARESGGGRLPDR